jgi:hypothetical protein
VPVNAKTHAERFDKFNCPKEDKTYAKFAGSFREGNNDEDKRVISDELCGDRGRRPVKRDGGQAVASECAGDCGTSD